MRRHERSLARQCALQIAYQSEIVGIPATQLIKEGLVPLNQSVGSYAQRLIVGVERHRDELDELIAQASKNWSVERMALVDSCILRSAVFEIRFIPQVPESVVINEAVELAKEYGGDDSSHRFVNGILGSIARMPRDLDAAALQDLSMEELCEGEHACEDTQAYEDKQARETTKNCVIDSDR